MTARIDNNDDLEAWPYQTAEELDSNFGLVVACSAQGWVATSWVTGEWWLAGTSARFEFSTADLFEISSRWRVVFVNSDISGIGQRFRWWEALGGDERVMAVMGRLDDERRSSRR